MPVNSIIIIAFFTILVIFAIASRNSTLDKLSLLPGEEVLFEDMKIKVNQSGAPQSTLFVNCIVRVTNQRIVIGQKFLFGKKYALRFVITYQNLIKRESKTKISKGYLNLQIDKSSVKLNLEEKKNLVRIIIPEAMLVKGQYLEYSTSYMDEYQKIF